MTYSQELMDAMIQRTKELGSANAAAKEFTKKLGKPVSTSTITRAIKRRAKAPAKGLADASAPGHPAPPMEPVPAEFVVAEGAKEADTAPTLDHEAPQETQPQAPAAAPAAAAAAPPPVVACGPLVDALCGIFDNSLKPYKNPGQPQGPPSPPQPITSEERKVLSDAFEPVVAKYLPMLGPYMIEVNLCICIIAVFGPRVMAARDRRIWDDQYFQGAPKPPVAPATAGAAPEAQPAQNEADLTTAGDDFIARLRSRS